MLSFSSSYFTLLVCLLGGGLLEAQGPVLLLHARQGVAEGLHVAQQHGGHHDAALLVAGLAGVVFELTRSPDALGACE